MQCAVTGDALEYLLQQHDLSVLETVMQNAVVFSRTKPDQKGQVVDRLSTNGIHQLFDGRPRHIHIAWKLHVCAHCCLPVRARLIAPTIFWTLYVHSNIILSQISALSAQLAHPVKHYSHHNTAFLQAISLLP